MENESKDNAVPPETEEDEGNVEEEEATAEDDSGDAPVIITEDSLQEEEEEEEEEEQVAEELSPIAESVAELQKLTESGIPNVPELVAALTKLSDLVKSGGPPVRVECLEARGYEAVVKAWSVICYSGVPTAISFAPDESEVRDATLEALYTLTAGYPDIVDDIGWILIQQAIDSRMPDKTLTLAMKLIRNVCIKSEQNREKISWELDLMERLVLLIKRDQPSQLFVREWCGAMKSLILSDDTRVAYNRAPERKRMIHQHDALSLLTRHLHTFEEDEATTNAIVVLLGSMACTENMCIAIESGNVFPAILKIFKTFPQNKMLVKNTISLLRYLNVSQPVREICNGFGLVKWVLQLMLQYKNLDDVLEVSLSCLAFMTLRNACHTAQLTTANGVQILLEILAASSEKAQLLKGICLTLRNVAANGGPTARSSILDYGGEAYLRQIQETFPDLKENYVLPTFRDLGLKYDEQEQNATNEQQQTSKSRSGSSPAATTNPADSKAKTK